MNSSRPHGDARPFTRVSRHAPCPICKHPDWCLVYHDSTILCMRVPSNQVAAGGLGGWLHTDDALNHEPFPIPKARPAPALPPDALDRAYSILFTLCPLSPQHLTLLTGPRHCLTIAQARRYGTIPADPTARAALARQWRERFGDSLRYVPGHDLRSAGILIPRRDYRGRIHSCQIRRDRSEPRYLCLGQGAGSAPHVPLRPVDMPTRRLWLTEGPKKADVSTDLLHVLVVGLSGVNTWRQALPVVKVLGAREVVVAFDQDAKLETREHVERYRNDLAIDLHKGGLAVFIASWDGTRAKGLDDLLIAGGSPDVRPWRQPSARAAAPLTPSPRRTFTPPMHSRGGVA